MIHALAAVLTVCLSVTVAPAQQLDAVEQVRAALEAGKPDRAVAIASEALAIDGDASEFLLLRALARYELRDEDRAAVDLRRYLSAGEGEGGLPSGLPDSFLAWASRISVASLGEVTTPKVPDVSLKDLDLGTEVREVNSHFVLDIEIVRIPVIVEAEGGDFMSGLDPGTFAVAEGAGPSQQVRDMISESEPTSVGILVDASADVVDRRAELERALRRLVATLRVDDEVFLLQFGDEARFLSDFTTDRQILEAAMRQYVPGDGRALYAGVALGLIQMRAARFDKKALIVVTAGDDTSSRVTGDVVQRAAQREAVSIHGVVLADGVPRWRPSASGGVESDDRSPGATEFLQRLVHNTGGLVALRPGNDERYGGLAGWLESAADDISDYINHQYLILHESRNPPPRGQWRSLMVKVSEPHDRVRFRSGFVR